MGQQNRGVALRRLVRLLQIHDGRCDGWTGVVEVARELGVTPRTIYRDLEAIREAGLPLVRGLCPVCLKRERGSRKK